MKQAAGPRGRDVPVREVGGTHVEVATVDLALGEIMPATRRRGHLDGSAARDDLIRSLVTTAKSVVTASSVVLGSGSCWTVAIPVHFPHRHRSGAHSCGDQ
jgi:hypothetical protein